MTDMTFTIQEREMLHRPGPLGVAKVVSRDLGLDPDRGFYLTRFVVDVYRYDTARGLPYHLSWTILAHYRDAGDPSAYERSRMLADFDTLWCHGFDPATIQPFDERISA